jgi:hypothetical protein
VLADLQHNALFSIWHRASATGGRCAPACIRRYDGTDISLVLGAQGQTVTWCDDLTSICFQRFYDEGVQTGWGYTFPDVDPNGGVPDEFIGIYTGPETAGWIGASLGGGMTQNPLIVAWLNEGKAMAGVRRTEYVQASPSPHCLDFNRGPR